ncbi:hypothetical protein BPNPMPFG_001236 [Mesorhizobium sp. AR07]|uniref:hypothetical protein n=1 Tax=Mesorhizobium sp. AR07 TaxID=2865838 RepID=UPI00215E6F5D|nr:hypothetical protein [Mesorhizobium sp. AR07]UVK45679.1 hypothetical protein BPNPMPFG_001236 [Mesorhizobium sp. AR07]
MTNEMDDEPDDTEDAIRANVLRRARSEGVKVAYETALAICKDPEAPAVAKASSQRTLLLVGGMLDKTDRQAEQSKAPHEMAPEELTRAVNRLLKRGRGKQQTADQSVFD